MLALQSGEIQSFSMSVVVIWEVLSEKFQPICLVPCRPVYRGNIPYNIKQALIKVHVGTPIWEDSIRVVCDPGVSKLKTPHLAGLFPPIPCAKQHTI